MRIHPLAIQGSVRVCSISHTLSWKREAYVVCSCCSPMHVVRSRVQKMEQDIVSADKRAEKQQKKLEQTAADKKAEDIANLEGEEGNDGSSDGRGEDPDGKDVKNITAELQKRTVEDIFAQFDTDNSGLIDFDEFRAMLPQLGIKMSMPKVSVKNDESRSFNTYEMRFHVVL